MKYRTNDNDVLDAICAAHYGIGAFDLAKIYAANMGLSAIGAILPAGLQIELPDDAKIEPEPQIISLVD